MFCSPLLVEVKTLREWIRKPAPFPQATQKRRTQRALSSCREAFSTSGLIVASGPSWVSKGLSSVLLNTSMCVSHSIMSDSLQPHGLEPTRLLCPWDSPGKNTGVGSYFLLQGNLPDPGIKPGSPALQVDSLPSEPSTQTQTPFLYP